MASGTLVSLTLAGMMSVPGCGGDLDPGQPSPGYAVRDSAAITIVTSHNPAWGDEAAWRLASAPTLTLGGAASDAGDMVWRVGGAARLSDGRTAMLTGGRDAPRVLIFNRSGRLERSFGRSGQGPGEFVNPSRFQLLAGDTIVIWESNYGRVTSFDPEGSLLGIRHLDLARIQEGALFAGGGDVVRPLSDGSFIVAPRAMLNRDRDLAGGEVDRPLHMYLRVRPDYSVDTLGAYGGAERVGYVRPDGGRTVLSPIMFAYSSVKSTDDSVRVYISHGDARGIDVFNDEGHLTMIIRRDAPPLPMSDDEWRTIVHRELDLNAVPLERRAEAERFYRDNLPIQSHFPTMTGFHVDRLGYLWVVDRRIGSDGVWSIFGPDGRWLGRLTLPLRTIYDIGEDYVLGLHVDDMMVESVLEYRLDRGGADPGP